MSRLDELIAEYCPNGVEYLTFENVLSYEQPSHYIVKSTKYNDDFNIPVLTAGQTFILGYTNEENGIYQASKDNPVIIFDDFTTANKWVDFKFKVKSSAMKILTSKNNNKYNIRYLYHVIQTIKYLPVDHSRQWIGTYSKFKIPVPPIEVQSEIVRILDNFTELTAELTARKKQYEYYRDELLTFDSCTTLRRESLGILADITTGTKPKEIIDNHTDFEYINAGTSNSGYTKNYNCNGDTVTTPSRGQGGIGFVGYQNKPFWLGPLCYKIRAFNPEIILNKFIYYSLQKNVAAILKIKREGGVPAVNRTDLAQILIPVPPLAEQERIVSILDRFDKLCNDISEGLPAEIEARKQQYEYYRDKLLTFKEKAA